MSWEPISIEELNELILNSIAQLPDYIIKTWNDISIKPIKWNEDEYGKLGGGFWVVSIFDSKVIWYNDIEEGFNISNYTKEGVIEEYSCEQLELYHILNRLFAK